ncbi:MAG: hypothetical protein IJ848_02975 [Alphaproteobacteria bacterium]|nr:hypothetical protein [Alphaproteobacteria bacterium]
MKIYLNENCAIVNGTLRVLDGKIDFYQEDYHNNIQLIAAKQKHFDYFKTLHYLDNAFTQIQKLYSNLCSLNREQSRLTNSFIAEQLEVTKKLSNKISYAEASTNKNPEVLKNLKKDLSSVDNGTILNAIHSHTTNLFEQYELAQKLFHEIMSKEELLKDKKSLLDSKKDLLRYYQAKIAPLREQVNKCYFDLRIVCN